MGWGRGFVGLTCCALMLGMPGVASAGELRAPPPAGSTFRAAAELVTVNLTALAPDAKGGIHLRGTVAVACGTKRLSVGLKEAVSGRVARDGTYDIDTTLVGPAEGIQTRGTVHLRGAFTDAGATAKITGKIVALDRTLTDAATVIKVDTGTVKAAPTSFDAIWIYDEELRLVYRIATF